MTVVFNDAEYPGGAPAADIDVMVRRLVRPGMPGGASYDEVDEVTIEGVWWTKTDDDGHWELDLDPTDSPDITPSGTFYQAIEHVAGSSPVTHFFVVPAAAAGPLWIGDYRASGFKSHSADEIAATPTGDLEGTTVAAQLAELDEEKAPAVHSHDSSGQSPSELHLRDFLQRPPDENGVQIFDGVIALNSPILTSAAGKFRSWMTGKPITVGKIGVGGAEVRTTVLSYQSPTQIQLAVDSLAEVTSAAPAGATVGYDDSVAVSAALAALLVAGGGTLIVDPGKYVLNTPVFQAFGAAAPIIRILGHGSASQFLPKVAKTSTAFRLASLEHLLMEGVTWVGTPTAHNDAQKILDLFGIYVADVRDVNFYGLTCPDAAQGTIFQAEQCGLSLRSFGFRSCGGSQALGTVYNKNWVAVDIRQGEFTDYGSIDGQFRPLLFPPIAWIVVGDSASDPNVELPIDARSGSRSQTDVVLTDLRLDEGAFKQIYINPPARRVERVKIARLHMNVSGVDGGMGVHAVRVDNLVVEDSSPMYAAVTLSERDGVKLEDVRNTWIRRCDFRGSARRITASPTCKSLTLEDNDGINTVVSDPATIVHEVRDGEELTLGRFGGIVTSVVDGPVADEDIRRPPAPDGTILVDRVNKRLDVKLDEDWWFADLHPQPAQPRPLPQTIADVVAHYDCSLLSGGHGSAVNLLEDQWLFGLHLTQDLLTSSRPTVDTGGPNGLKVLRFDGAGDFMFGPFQDVGPLTVWMVASRHGAGGASGSVLVNFDPANGVEISYTLRFSAAALLWEVRDPAYKPIAENGTATPLPYSSIIGWHDNTTSKLYRNGVEKASIAAGADPSTVTRLVVGSFYGNEASAVAPFSAAMLLAEMAIYRGGISAADRLKLDTYASTKWGAA